MEGLHAHSQNTTNQDYFPADMTQIHSETDQSTSDGTILRNEVHHSRLGLYLQKRSEHIFHKDR